MQGVVLCLVSVTRPPTVAAKRADGVLIETTTAIAANSHRLVLQALAGLRLIPAMDTQPATIPQPTSVQTRLLELLAVDPTQPP